MANNSNWLILLGLSGAAYWYYSHKAKGSAPNDTKSLPSPTANIPLPRAPLATTPPLNRALTASEQAAVSLALADTVSRLNVKSLQVFPWELRSLESVGGQTGQYIITGVILPPGTPTLLPMRPQAYAYWWPVPGDKVYFLGGPL